MSATSGDVRDNIKGATVDVAYNRHKRLWSVRVQGKVVAYTEALLLSNVTFIIQEAGRQRAIQTGKRNVHAFARGTLLNIDTCPLWPGMERINYNSFRGPFFTVAETGEPIARASWVTANDHRMYIRRDQ